MTTTAHYQIALSAADLTQALEGLRIRATAWRKTAEYLRHGFSDGDLFICEECSDAHEATCIAEHYERIVANIEDQIVHQKG